mmetsp:Transcript_10750/g.15730  ORF Transcript_10750/g.15730 Transcript_10750/m.15730 type:complete len:333 (-) Transcript_10750:24-1022(-)
MKLAEKRKVTIGYVCSEKKRKRYMEPFNDYIIKNKAKTHQLIHLCEGNKPETEWPKVDIFLIRLTEQLTSSDPGDQIILNKVRNYMKLYPDVCVIEPFDKIASLLDRNLMASLFKKLSSCKTPNFEMFHLKGTVPNKIRYPIMVKNDTACGSKESHEMHIFQSENEFKAWREEERDDQPVSMRYLAQEFLNHKGLIYKCYVIHNTLWVQQRGSIEDMDELIKMNLIPLSFNSQKMKGFKNFVKNIPDENISKDTMHYKICTKIMHELYECTKLDLFGFDIIFANEEQPYIVDMNYFPGYKGIEDRDEHMFNMLMTRFEEHCSKQNDNDKKIV